MITIVPVLRTDPQSVDRVAERLVEALPGYSVSDIVARYVEGRWSMWIGSVSDEEEPVTFVFLLEHTREGLLIPALQGFARHRWISYIETWAREYAHTNGFSKIIMWGRMGWMKDARERGWDPERVLFTMEVE